MKGHAAIAVVGLLLLAACSGDDGGDEVASTTTAGAPAAPTTTAAPVATLADTEVATTTESPADLPGYHVHRPADLAAFDEPRPVVVWANGGCVRHDETWHTLLDRWAAAGVVVVSITTPPPGTEGLSAATSAADQAAAIDWAEGQDAGDGEYAGRLDLDRVVAAGNSCGGITSFALAGEDDRVDAVFVLSGSSVGPGASREAASAVMDRVDAPVGFAVGGPEDIARDQALQDVDVLPAGVPGMVAARAEADHVVVSTDEAILADVAGIGLHWLDLALYGDAAALATLEHNPCETCPPGQWTLTARQLDTLVSE